jgi:pimeloyl-ACP methyl ester carboxylesterase
MELLRRYPDRYKAYIGIGQVANTLDQERISIHYCIDTFQRSHNQSAVAELRRLGEPPYQQVYQAITLERTFLFQCGGWAWKNYSMNMLFADLFSFPLYSIADYWAYHKGTITSSRAICSGQYWSIAPEKSDTLVNTPVAFFIGRHDFNTPAELAERYFEKLKSPCKEKTYFEQSAHMLLVEEPEKFQKEALRFFSMCNRNAP